MVKLEIQFILGANKNEKRVVMFVKYLYLLYLLKPWGQVLLFLAYYWKNEVQRGCFTPKLGSTQQGLL